MADGPYAELREHGMARPIERNWLEAVCIEAERRYRNCQHGDFERWTAALAALPDAEPGAELDLPAPRFGKPAESRESLASTLMALHPWRKGPLEIAGVHVDAEWRSDWKWSRIAPHIDLSGARVLDVGCGNGYYGWRMLGAGADLVIGIDPTWVYVMQWLACRHFGGNLPNFVLPLGIEDLPGALGSFDLVFSMGVLYHRREPMPHLSALLELTRPGGKLVLETLVLPDEQADEVLEPAGRYARMRNVWAIPGCERLCAWVARAGFLEPEVVNVAPTTFDEQRTTEWMRFESLDKTLDPENPANTVEGHPAPRRAILTARRA